MSSNPSLLSREEQLKLWKEKKQREKKKDRIESQRVSPSYSTEKSLMSHTHATRSQSIRRGPLTNQNPNLSLSLDQKSSNSRRCARARTVAVKEIEIPTRKNTDSPFRNDMISPLASNFQNTPNHELPIIDQDSLTTDIQGNDDSTPGEGVPKCSRRRRTDRSTLLLPIPSLRDHMTQSTSSPVTEQDEKSPPPAFSQESSSKAYGMRKSCYETLQQDEHSSMGTPESIANDSKISSSDHKSDRLMDIDEENCVTEWEEQENSPPVFRPRRRTDSSRLLLPIPSLRENLTPIEDNTSPKQSIQETSCNQESSSPSESGFFHDNYQVPSMASSFSPFEDITHSGPCNKSRQSRTGELQNNKAIDSSVLLLPIPPLRQELKLKDDNTATLDDSSKRFQRCESTPFCDNYSSQERGQTTPIDSCLSSINEAAQSDFLDNLNCFAVKQRRDSLLPVSGDTVPTQPHELPEKDDRVTKRFVIERVQDFPENALERSGVEVGDGFVLEDTDDTNFTSNEVSFVVESDERANQPLEFRSLDEEYREPVKLNGRTVLLSISEEPMKQNIDEINRLRDQVEQLSVKNQLLTGSLYKFRNDYEERVTPFRDLFEQNAKLKEENKKLLLLKAENNILKSQNEEILEGASMLESQTMLAIQKALERQKLLEEERDEAKSRAKELERKLQELLAR